MLTAFHVLVIYGARHRSSCQSTSQPYYFTDNKLIARLHVIVAF